MKIVAMGSISNVADMTHSWSEITIWYLTENNVLMIAGCFPALRPFWRVAIGKYSSYLSSNASRKNPPRGENGQSTEDKELQVYTVGSQPKLGKKPNLYSTTIRVSSEERLCPRLDGSSVETIERILHNHGDERFERQACIASTRTGGISPSDCTKITVTSEVEIK
ncbi:hypothetical protein J4E90_006966 [Alternaria incomplexa]|nr:uncharacterized protein J4E90_006966 [Alternaria incomplexa]KAI4910711.1 hypothetical protein J4E90_006966 [Alternaria incomplexa]